jgi:iron-sulfur cluster assembly accessory protein
MIKVSDTAAKQVAISLEKMGAKKPALRIAIIVQEDGSFHYNMGFDETLHEGDKVFEEKNIKFIVDMATLPLVGGMTMDYVDIEGKQEIIFLNPNDPNYKPPTD